LTFAAFADANTFAANAAVRCLKAARADEADVVLDEDEEVGPFVIDVATVPVTGFFIEIDEVVVDKLIGGGTTTAEALEVIGTDAFFCSCCEELV
jgi:hypothetical protein